jgi:hypothetical protein
MGALRSMTIRACPRCGGKSIRRSHRVGFMERCLLRMSSVRPYRCLDCDRRFYLYDGFVPAMVSRRGSFNTSH